MARAKPRTPPLTDAEEAKIQSQIAADPDDFEPTDAELAEARPFAEVFPKLAASIRRGRGAQKAPTKKQVTLRLSRDVIERFKADGPGWQARIDAALRKAAGL